MVIYKEQPDYECFKSLLKLLLCFIVFSVISLKFAELTETQFYSGK